MHKVIAIAALLLACPALAEPMPPVRMVGSCPPGYAAGVDWCVPLPGTTREAVQWIQHCFPGWEQSGLYCLGPEKPGKRPAMTQGWKELLPNLGSVGW